MNRTKDPRPYIQARLEQSLHQEASVELIMSNQTWQDLLTKLVVQWVRKQRKMSRLRNGGSK